MIVRRAKPAELPELLRLYAFLHPEGPRVNPTDLSAQNLWTQILADPKLRYFFAEGEGEIVATCTLALIPNLTRCLRPYGLIENVVTDPLYRRMDMEQR